MKIVKAEGNGGPPRDERRETDRKRREILSQIAASEFNSGIAINSVAALDAMTKQMKQDIGQKIDRGYETIIFQNATHEIKIIIERRKPEPKEGPPIASDQLGDG